MFLGISSMIVASMIDTIYIGWIGTRELAAVSFSFPVVMGLSSVSMGLGVGATSIMARAIGGGKREASFTLGTHTLVLVMLLVVSLAVGGWLSGGRLFSAMGADAVLLPLVLDYMNIWFFGLPLFAAPMVAMNMLRATGNARTPGVLMSAGALLQVAIAPALIFGIPGLLEGIGYLGSAWAFVVSRGLTAIATILVLQQRHMFQPIGALASMLNSWREVLRIGIPSMLTNLIGPVSMSVAFWFLAPHGHAVVAAFGIAVRVESLALMILMSLSSSLSVLVGQNWGRHQYSRIRKGLGLSYRFSFAWGVFALALLGGFGAGIVGVINDNPDVIRATHDYLLIVPLSYALLGVSMMAGSCFIALGRPMPSLVLSIGRMLLLFVPLAWLGDLLWGYRGVFGAMALANLIVAAVGYFWVVRTVPLDTPDGEPTDYSRV
jgi:putative MATE family efflux protein